MENKPSKHRYYIYNVTYVAYNDKGEARSETLRAFERRGAAVQAADEFWAAYRKSEYGEPVKQPLDETHETPKQRVYRLQSDPSKYKGAYGKYRRAEVVVARIWLDVTGSRLMTENERKAQQIKELHGL